MILKMVETPTKINSSVENPKPRLRAAWRALNSADAERHLALLGIGPTDTVWVETIDDVRTPGPDGDPVKRNDLSLKRQGNDSLARSHTRLEALNNKGAGIFIAVNPINGDRRTLQNVQSIRAVFGEFDDGMPELPLEPTLVVESSTGKYHAYFVCPDLTPDDFDGVMQRLVDDYGSDPNAKDRTRVLRLAGTWHMKNADAPFQVRTVGASGRVYSRPDILAAFPPKQRKASTVPQVQALKASADEIAKIEDALQYVPADEYEGWCRVGMALHEFFNGNDLGLEIWDRHSQRSKKYAAAGPDSPRAKWQSFGNYSGNPIGVATLFKQARDNGWRPKRSTVADIANRAQAFGDFVPRDTRTAAEYGAAVETWGQDEIDELLNRMNAEHALVSLGSSTRYLHERPTRTGKSELFFLRPEDLKRMYANVLVETGGRRLGAFDLWDRWKKRRQYRGVGMFPDAEGAPEGYLNLWRGFAIQPKDGNWGAFKDHLLKDVCGDDQQNFDWLMDWLAHLVQFPHEKPGTAVVLRSDKGGTGKSMIIRFISKIFGVHAMTVSNAEHVIGRFNGHMMRTIFLGLEEAVWAGSKTAEGVLKSLITEERITIEQKGMDPISVDNYVRLFIASNEDWVVPTDAGGRRFFVLEVDDTHAHDRRYFEPIFEQMDKQGGLEAMLHELLNRKIESNIRKPPETAALQDQREQSLDGTAKWLLEVARNGVLRVSATTKGEYGFASTELALNEDSETEIPCGAIRDAAEDNCDQYERRTIDKRLGKLLKKIGVDRQRRGPKDSRRWVYLIPRLALLRWNVQETLKVRVDGAENRAIGGKPHRCNPLQL